jgi:acetyl esterase
MKRLYHPQSSPQDRAFRPSWRSDDIAVRVFGARSKGHAVPLILHFHGGLFNCGSIESTEQFAQALSGIAVFACVDYPLAPRCQFPETVEVAYEALRWAAAHAGSFGADARRIIVTGEQAGGNLAAATAIIARDRRWLAGAPRPPAAQILLTPLLDPGQTSSSLRANVDSPCRKGWASYLPRISDLMHPYAAPVYSMRLASLPPTLIITAERDPFRDEAEQYAGRLIGFGVKVELFRIKNADGNLVNPEHPQFHAVVGAVSRFISESHVHCAAKNDDPSRK